MVIEENNITFTLPISRNWLYLLQRGIIERINDQINNSVEMNNEIILI